jgi:hypothetical protein
MTTESTPTAISTTEGVVVRVSLATTPYPERQLIITAADEVVALKDNPYVKYTSAMAGEYIQLASWFFSLKRTTLGRNISDFNKLYNRADTMRSRGIPVRVLSFKEASALRFPLGHPRSQVLYVGHPASYELYYPMANFHTFLFEHKVAEALRLLIGLGVREAEVEHVVGWSTSTMVNAALSIPVDGLDVKPTIGVKETEAGSRRILFRIRMKPGGQPVLPKDLVWFPHETLWQEVARARLDHGLEAFGLDVKYEDDYGINVGLKAKVAQIGIDLGGEFKKYESTIWRIEGEFGSPT